VLIGDKIIFILISKNIEFLANFVDENKYDGFNHETYKEVLREYVHKKEKELNDISIDEACISGLSIKTIISEMENSLKYQTLLEDLESKKEITCWDDAVSHQNRLRKKVLLSIVDTQFN